MVIIQVISGMGAQIAGKPPARAIAGEAAQSIFTEQMREGVPSKRFCLTLRRLIG